MAPGNNLTFTGDEPAILQWDVPKYAVNLQATVKITSPTGFSTINGYGNGENLNQEIQKDYRLLTPGVNHITVTLSERGNITQYQGWVDIIYNP
ncbi:hypothetical protein [Desulfosporosinus sp. OT]|uniref:hypothetical protein n=1 Tax=Desulfosporosinus sp. OT TaxID=913865 RepID=UPI00058AEB40|nr:hypothetical protein [Desulfosporosinus sp. OT]